MKAPPPPRVPRPVMYHNWNHITFIHWRYPATIVQSMLPQELTVETLDGSAWIGLTPFRMEGLRAPMTPTVPWLSTFPEVNVRTYVHDKQERSGIWFLSLDAALLPAVLAARAGYWLPYFWSNMAVELTNDRIIYRCRRRWPGPTGARGDAEVVTGPPLAESEYDELAHFLTARYRLFSVVAGRLVAAEAEHPAWPLHRAELAYLDQTLLHSAHLPSPTGEPLIHMSPGVPVRIGMWHR